MDGVVLIADDDRTIRTVLTHALSRAGCRVHATGSMETLLRWVEEGRGNLVISDVVMPDGDGIEMIPKIHALRKNLPIITISAQNTMTTAIRAADAKVFDYFPKPFDLQKLLARVSKGLTQGTEKHLAKSTSSAEQHTEFNEAGGLIGRSKPMQELYKKIAQVMNLDLPLLISGETGTGKSMLAQRIFDHSKWQNFPYLALTGTEIADIEKAAQLFRQARGGTVFIDNIDNLDCQEQQKLCQFLDVEKNPPRLISTCGVDFLKRAESGVFRPDFLYRINGAFLTLPALKDRGEDIIELARYFLGQYNSEMALESKAESIFIRYSWPGNIRQLANVIAVAAAGARGSVLTKADIKTALLSQPMSGEAFDLINTSDLDSALVCLAENLLIERKYTGKLGNLHFHFLQKVEKPFIETILREMKGNQIKAAEILGINRNTLRKKVQNLEIQVKRGTKLI